MDERLRAHVGANISQFMRRMNTVENKIDALPDQVMIKIKGDIWDISNSIRWVRGALSSLPDKKVRIKGDISDLSGKLVAATAAIESLPDRTIDINGDYNIGESIAANMIPSGDSSTSLNLNTAKFHTKLTTARAAIRAFPRRVKVSFQDNITELDNKIKKMAHTIESIQALVGNAFVGSMLSASSAISPILSSLVASFAMVGNSVGVVGGAALGLASSMTTAAAATGGLAAVAIPTFTDLRNGFADVQSGNKAMSEFSSEMQTAIGAMQRLSERHKELVQVTRPDILIAFSEAINAGNQVLKEMSPGIESVASAFKGLMKKLNATVTNAGDMQTAFELFNTRAGPAFENWVTIAGNVLRGFINLMVAFDPLARTMEGGLLDMTSRWAEWTSEIQNSDGLKTFISYVQENGPKLLSIVSNITIGFVEFFKTFAGMSSDMLTGLQNLTERFREWAAATSSSQEFQQFMDYIRRTGPKVIDLIGNMAKFGLNLLIALAPLGEKVLDIANAFFNWINPLMESNRWIGVVMGAVVALYGAFRLLMPLRILISALFLPLNAVLSGLGPVIRTVVTRVTGLATSFVKNFGKISTTSGSSIMRVIGLLGRFAGPIGIVISLVVMLANYVINNWDSIVSNTQAAYQTVRSTIVGALQQVWSFGQQILSQFTDFWQQNSENIMQIVRVLKRFLVEFFGSLFTTLNLLVSTGTEALTSIFSSWMSMVAGTFRGGWQILTGIVQGFWTIFSGLVSGGLDIALGLFGAFISLLTGDWSGFWQNMAQVGRGAVTIITSIGRGLWQMLSGIFRGGFTSLLSIVTNGWSIIQEVFDWAIEFLTGGLVQNGFSRMVEGIWTHMQNAWNVVSTAWSMIVDFIAGTDLFQVGVWIFQNFAKGILTAIPGVNESTLAIGQSVVSGIQNFFGGGKTQQEGKKAGDQFSSGVNSSKEGSKQAGSDISWGSILGMEQPFNEGQGKNAGKKGGQDFSFGLEGMMEQIKNIGSNLGGGAVTGMETGFGNQPQQLGRQAGMGVRDGLQPWIHPTREMGKEIANASMTGAGTVWQGSLAMQTMSKDAASGLPDGLQSQTAPINAVSENLATGSLNSTTNTFGGSTQMNNIGADAGGGLDQGLYSQQPSIDSTSAQLANGSVNSAESAFQGTLAMQNIGSQAAGGMGSGLYSQNSAIGNTSASLADNATNSASGAFDGEGAMNSVGYTAGAGLNKGMLLQMITIQLTAENMANNVVDEVDGILSGDGPNAAGRAAAQGLANGIRSRRGSVVSAARSVARSADNALRAELDIHSPSRVAKISGNYFGEGLAVGIDDMHRDVIGSASSIASLASHAMQKEANRGFDMSNLAPAAGMEMSMHPYMDDRQISNMKKSMAVGASNNVKQSSKHVSKDVQEFELPDQTVEVIIPLDGEVLARKQVKLNARELQKLQDSQRRGGR